MVCKNSYYDRGKSPLWHVCFHLKLFTLQMADLKGFHPTGDESKTDIYTQAFSFLQHKGFMPRLVYFHSADNRGEKENLELVNGQPPHQILYVCGVWRCRQTWGPSTQQQQTAACSNRKKILILVSHSTFEICPNTWKASNNCTLFW